MKKALILTPFLLSSIYAKEKNFLEEIIFDTNNYRKDFYESVVNVSSAIDGYFVKEKIKKTSYDDSYIYIQLSAFSNEDHSLKFDQKVRVRLKLPKLKDKFKLEIESEEVRETNDNVEDHTQTNKSDDYNLALAYYKSLKNSVDLSTKLGLKLKHKLDPFLRVEVKKTWKINKEFEYTLSQRLNQSLIKKLESTTYLRFDKKINDIFSIHNYYEHYWHSLQDQYNELYSSIYLQHKVSSKGELTYTLNSSINNIHNSIEDKKTELRPKRYSFNIRYRHHLKSWLHYDVIPEMYFKDDNDFSRDHYAIRFNLGIYFNKSSFK